MRINHRNTYTVYEVGIYFRNKLGTKSGIRLNECNGNMRVNVHVKCIFLSLRDSLGSVKFQQTRENQLIISFRSLPL